MYSKDSGKNGCYDSLIAIWFQPCMQIPRTQVLCYFVQYHVVNFARWEGIVGFVVNDAFCS